MGLGNHARLRHNHRIALNVCLRLLSNSKLAVTVMLVMFVRLPAVKSRHMPVHTTTSNLEQFFFLLPAAHDQRRYTMGTLKFLKTSPILIICHY
jgi:hypothetical protein